MSKLAEGSPFFLKRLWRSCKNLDHNDSPPYLRPSALLSPLIFYSLVTLLYFFPLVLHLADQTPHWGLNYALLGNARIIGEQLGQLASPLETTRILFPVGYTIHEGFLPSLMVFVLGVGREFVLGLNLVLLLSYVLACLGGYCLSYEVSRSRFGSLIAGLYFGFCAQHYANMGVYPICHIEWLAWYLYSLIAYLRKGSRVHWVLLTGSFLAASLSSWYFTVFAIVATVVFLLMAALMSGSLGRALKVLISLAGSCLVLLPFSPLILLGRSGLATGGLKYQVDGSADLLSFFLPPSYHWGLESWVQGVQESWLGNPSLQSNYLGTASLLVALAGIFVRTRCPGWVRFGLLVLILGSFVMALGPYLAIDGLGGWHVGQSVEEIEGTPMPFRWLGEWFPFRVTRATSRYSLMTTLGLVVFLAVGLGWLWDLGRRKSRLVLAPGALLIFVLELWPVWPFTLKAPVPASTFYDSLSKSSDDFSVLELPLKNNAYRILYYATEHSKKVIGGAVDKPFLRFHSRILGIPFLRQLALVGTPAQGTPRFQDVRGFSGPGLSSQVAEALRIRYAIIHRWDESILSFGDYYQPERLSQVVEEPLNQTFQLSYEDDLIRVYERRPSGGDWLFPAIGEGWGSVEEHQTYVDRPMLGREGFLEVYSSANQTADLALRLAVILVPERDLQITLDEKTLYEGTLPRRSRGGESELIELKNIALSRGINRIRIATSSPVPSIAEVHGGRDDRRIGFLLNGFQISKGR